MLIFNIKKEQRGEGWKREMLAKQAAVNRAMGRPK